MSYPNRYDAEIIWQQGIDYSRAHHVKSPQIDKEYVFHTQGVAKLSELFAQKMSLNEEKAYVLGLLHDHGKRQDERQQDCFHGILGYRDMLSQGYTDVAQICLTHTFVNKDFSNEDYSYPDHWLDECRSLLKPLIYSDYDLIIQYADMFFEGLNCVTPEQRIEGITSRYQLSAQQENSLRQAVTYLKTTIDNKCQCDTYQFLEIIK